MFKNSVLLLMLIILSILVIKITSQTQYSIELEVFHVFGELSNSIQEKKPSKVESQNNAICNPIKTRTEIDSKLDEQWYSHFLTQLSQQADFASQYTNALFIRGDSKKNELNIWSDFLKKYPEEPLASFQLINSCNQAIEHPSCSDSNLDKLLELNNVNKFNGAIWDQIAVLRLQRSDKKGAALAMRKASEAPFYNQYHAERLGLTLEAVENIQGESIGADLMVWIFGLYNSAHHASFTIQKFCEVESEINVEVADVCLNLGKMIEVNSYSYVSILRGLLIQQVTYLAINDEDGLTELNKRREAVSQQIKESHAGDNLILTNNTIRANWLKSYIDSGELEAAYYLVEEARLHCLLPEKPAEIEAF